MGSCAPMGYVIYHEMALAPAQSISLSTGGASDKATFHATPGSLVRFGVEAEVTTPSVQEDPERIDEEYLARFKFPISYTIRNSSGEVLLRKEATLAWKDGGSLSKQNEETTSTGGTLTAKTNLKKFTMPDDGSVDIEIALGPDTTYQASYTAPQLHLYEGMIDNTWYITGSIAMFFVGFILALVGFVFFLTASTRAGTPTPYSAHDTTGVEDSRKGEINQNAMIIQLSAFAGYMIPFGNLILPIILWQIWREKDTYIDKMGCEAVNFQLSMLIYYFCSFILMFVLIGFILFFAAMIFHFTCIIIASVQTSQGVDYRYPMTIRFFKAAA